MDKSISVNTQSSIRIAGSSIIYFDPLEIPAKAHDADYVCITHSHYDHFSPKDIAKVAKKGTRFVFPASMGAEVKEYPNLFTDNVFFLDPGEQCSLADGITLSAVPAYNVRKSFHPKENRWCGYVLEMDGQRFYVAGDTDGLPENLNIDCDWAFVPIGGTYTMDYREASEFINALDPKTVVPTHFGTIVGHKTDGNSFADLVDPSIEVKNYFE